MKYVYLFLFLTITFTLQGQDDHILLHPNKGQWEKEILYKVDLNNGEILLTKDGFTYVLHDFQQQHSHHHDDKSRSDDHEEKINYHIIKSLFQETSWKGIVAEENPSEAYRNYFLGNDQKKWASNVHSFQKISLKEYYPGVDFIIEGQTQQLKYSFTAVPNADVTKIRYHIDGANKVSISKTGNLIINNRFGAITENQPIAWNVIEGKKHYVKTKFHLEGNQVTFEFPNDYNHNYPLVIDPVLSFSTFTGSTLDNWGMTATPDTKGNLFAGGVAFAGIGEYPTTVGAFDVTFNGGASSGTSMHTIPGFDITLSKFNATGTSLIYSTYIGGSDNEAPHSLIADQNGDLYMMGVTGSSNFPVTTNGYNRTFAGGTAITANGLGYQKGTDIFVLHLNAAGSALIGSTFLGGKQTDGINSGALDYNYGDSFRGEINLDSQGQVLICSTTQSTDFPTVQASQSTLSGNQDAIMTKFDAALTGIKWSTYFGGTGVETGNSVQLSSDGFIFLAGGTSSAGLSFTNGAKKIYGGGSSDGYLAKFDSNNGNFIDGTYIGFNRYDQTYFVQVDIDNNVYVYGQTESNFPISPNKYGNPNSGQFIQKYNPTLSTTIWTTMIGAGSGFPEISPTAFSVSNCFEIYLSGWGGMTNQLSSNFAKKSSTQGFNVTSDAYQSTTNGNNFYIAVLGKDAESIKYATFFGGLNSANNHVDGGTSRFDKNGNIYHAVCAACFAGPNGFTSTPGVYSTTNKSEKCNLAAFKFELNSIKAKMATPQNYYCMPQEVKFSNNSENGNTYLWDFGDGTSSTEFAPSHTYSGPGTYKVGLYARDINKCYKNDSVFVEVKIGDFQAGVIRPKSPICSGTSTQLEAFGGKSYKWSPANLLDNPNVAKPIATILNTTVFSVIVTDTCGTATYEVTLETYQTVPTVSEDTAVCKGSSVQLFAYGTEAQIWTPSSSLDDSKSASPIASPTEDTKYYVTLTSLEHCVFKDSIFVKVVIDKPIPILDDTVKICKWTNTTINADGAPSYAWYPNELINTTKGKTVIVSPLESKYYHCIFTNICGSREDSIYVYIRPPFLHTHKDTTICSGDQARLEGFGAKTYLWHPYTEIENPTNAVVWVSPLKDKTYTLTGVSEYGCKDTVKVTVFLHPINLVDASADVITIEDKPAHLEALAQVEGTYSWSPAENLSCAICQKTIATVAKNTAFVVTFTDQNSCKTKDTVQVLFRGTFFIPNTFTPNGDKYNNNFNLIGNNIKNFELEIFNRWGELLYHSKSLEEFWDGTYRNSVCEIGTYTWKITYSDYTFEKKVITGHVNIVK